VADDIIHMSINGTTYQISTDPYSFTTAELNAVERHAGMTVREWAAKLVDPSVSSMAWTALAWIAVRRSGDFVRWDEFEERVHLADLLASVDGGPVTPADVVAAGSGDDPASPAASPTVSAAPSPAPNRAARRKSGTAETKRKTKLTSAPPV
jgi:hypothetical protein